ncbi:hypothetical protein CBL_20778 [Carabus blaptoides fortunei]
MEVFSVCGKFVRSSLTVQGNLAGKVAKHLNEKVYVYDLVDKFKEATVLVVDGIRVLMVDGKYAVLSQAAQTVFRTLPQSQNTYRQYAVFTTQLDDVGLYVTRDTVESPNREELLEYAVAGEDPCGQSD